jgi:hypothetical protein
MARNRSAKHIGSSRASTVASDSDAASLAFQNFCVLPITWQDLAGCYASGITIRTSADGGSLAVAVLNAGRTDDGSEPADEAFGFRPRGVPGCVTRLWIVRNRNYGGWHDHDRPIGCVRPATGQAPRRGFGAGSRCTWFHPRTETSSSAEGGPTCKERLVREGKAHAAIDRRRSCGGLVPVRSRRRPSSPIARRDRSDRAAPVVSTASEFWI